MNTLNLKTLAVLLSLSLFTFSAKADFVINDDLIVDGSACIGFDCVNGESFSFDTIRLKENNLRIKFDDTSVAASFPRNDWQLTANASANGGASKFSIDDITGNRTPFTVEANARSHSLYVDDGGRIGNRTSTPSTEIHTIDGDTPTLRLQQDGSSGFAPQTWDLAGNETNFFVRDVSNGSTLPFRIRPGAPTSSIFIDVNGNVGFGTASPAEEFELEDGQIFIDNSAGNQVPRFKLENGTYDNPNIAGDEFDWFIDVNNIGALRVSLEGSGQTEFELSDAGDLEIQGSFVSNGTTLNVPDYVFGKNYQLRTVDELKQFISERSHLPNVPSAAEIKANGVNITTFQMALLEKIEELTLYTIHQEERLLKQEHQLQQLQQQIAVPN